MSFSSTTRWIADCRRFHIQYAPAPHPMTTRPRPIILIQPKPPLFVTGAQSSFTSRVCGAKSLLMYWPMISHRRQSWKVHTELLKNGQKPTASTATLQTSLSKHICWNAPASLCRQKRVVARAQCFAKGSFSKKLSYYTAFTLIMDNFLHAPFSCESDSWNTLSESLWTPFSLKLKQKLGLQGRHGTAGCDKLLIQSAKPKQHCRGTLIGWSSQYAAGCPGKINLIWCNLYGWSWMTTHMVTKLFGRKCGSYTWHKHTTY